jgi:WD40 repeat protein
LCTAGGGAPAFSPDGRFIAVSGSGSACADANGVTVWDVAQGIPRLTLRGHTGSIGALAYSPDGRLIATGGRDQMVRLWDADSGESLAVLREHDEPVSALAFSLDGARLASGGADGTLVYWEVASRRRLWDEREHSAQIRSIVPLADESLTTLSSDGDLLTWSARGSVTHEARISQSAGAVAGMADGRSVALANREDFLVWVQDASFAETYLFEHTMNPEGMAISRDGRRLALTQVVGGVAVFDLPSGRPVSGWQANAGSGNPAFSPDGSVLATRSNREVMLWPAEPASLTAAARATGAVLDSLDLRSIDLQVAAPGWVSSPVADSTGTLGEQVLRSTQRSGSAIVVTFGRSVEPGQSCSTLVPPATSQSDVPWMPAGWIGERRMGALMCLSLAEGVLTARFDGYLSAGADISRVYYLLEAVRQAAIAKWGAV